MIEQILTAPNIEAFILIGVITVISLVLIKVGFARKEDITKSIGDLKTEMTEVLDNNYEELNKKIEDLKDSNECIFQKKDLCESKHWHYDKLLELVINNSNKTDIKIDNLHSKFDSLTEKLLEKK